jgi:hypothetical protein
VSRSRSGRRERPPEDPERGTLQPKYRRAFGCVTWVSIAVLIFLAAAFILPLPLRYIGNGELFSELELRLALVVSVLYLPGMALGAVLGARTYRVERRFGMRAGAGIGAAVGLTSYLLLFFVLIEGTPLLAVPLAVSSSLLIYALFATRQNLARRKQAVLLAVGISILSGTVALLFDFDLLGLLGALFSTAAAAVGGLVGGVGYARAGGDEMLPPDALRKEPQQKPR